MKKFLILILLILIGCNSESYIIIDGEKITVEVPNTPKEMQKGLMFRESLCDSCGMLFIFENETIQRFWMKNTLIPLDMVFINSNNIVVDLIHAVPCKVENCEIYTPKENSIYVLETNANKFSEEIIGKKVKIS